MWLSCTITLSRRLKHLVATIQHLVDATKQIIAQSTKSLPAAAAAPLLSTPRKSPRRRLTHLLAMPTAPRTITRDAIAAAHAELASREQAAAAGADLDDLRDVVIATNVTSDDLARVPAEWLHGLKVSLRGGVLIAVCRDSLQHGYAVSEVVAQTKAFAVASRNYNVGSNTSLSQGPGQSSQPDVTLMVRSTTPGEPPLRIIVLEVEVAHRSGPQMVVNTAQYLTDVPEVECVVCLKFYPPRQPELDRHDQLRMPALAIAFRRGHNNRRRIRVSHVRSFGNADLHASALHWMRGAQAHALIENPVDDIGPLVAGAPHFPDAIDALNVLASLPGLQAHAQAVAQRTGDELVFAIQVPAAVPVQFRLDLVEVFLNAVDGWNDDPRAVLRGTVDGGAAGINREARAGGGGAEGGESGVDMEDGGATGHDGEAMESLVPGGVEWGRRTMDQLIATENRWPSMAVSVDLPIAAITRRTTSSRTARLALHSTARETVLVDDNTTSVLLLVDSLDPNIRYMIIFVNLRETHTHATIVSCICSWPTGKRTSLLHLERR